ncbi:MAG: hypothetical protein PHO26_09320 [Dehalococcoidia bacterium]|nr:hypothetical protein [Dehalococcoidia bacterium]MDD5495026.1 hypothetical protein [Dehalococcoidia bacterium]
MQKLSKGFYLGSIIGSWVMTGLLLIIGIVILFAAGVTAEDMKEANWGLIGGGVIFILLAIAVGIYGTVIGCILLYKAWKAIQDGQPRTTPGKAVGFLFIPFFNLYWIFVAYWGFAQDFNKYLNVKSLAVPKLSEGLFLAYPILILCSGIPYIGSLAGLAEFGVGILVCNFMIDAVNNLVGASPQPAPAAV